MLEVLRAILVQAHANKLKISIGDCKELKLLLNDLWQEEDAFQAGKALTKWFDAHPESKRDERTQLIWARLFIAKNDGNLAEGWKDVFREIVKLREQLISEHRSAELGKTADLDEGLLEIDGQYQLEYVDSKGKKSKRDIKFRGLGELKGRQTLQAIDLSTNRYKAFRVDRIESLSCLKTSVLII